MVVFGNIELGRVNMRTGGRVPHPLRSISHTSASPNSLLLRELATIDLGDVLILADSCIMANSRPIETPRHEDSMHHPSAAILCASEKFIKRKRGNKEPLTLE
jgi:hypothetical protein